MYKNNNTDNTDNNKQIFDNQCFLIYQQEQLLKLNSEDVDKVLSLTEPNQQNNKNRIEAIQNKCNGLEELRKNILKCVPKEPKDTFHIIHVANFIIKQNNIKLEPIIGKVLSKLSNEKKKDKNTLNMKMRGVGGPKNESMPLTAFKPGNNQNLI